MTRDVSDGSEVTQSESIVLGRRVDKVHVEAARALRKDMTPEERLLWNQLRSNRLHSLHFRRQQVVRGFIVDFYCHAARLAVEVDGGIHDEQVDYDTERDLILFSLGITILRITNDQVRTQLSGVLDRISSRALSRIAGANSG